MQSKMKKMAVVLVVILLMTTSIYSAAITEQIQVLKNYINLEVNGEFIDTPNFVLDGTTYVPIRTVAETLGANVEWDQESNTARIVSKTGTGLPTASTFTKQKVDAFEPRISLDAIGIQGNEIDLVALKQENNLVQVSWEIDGGDLRLQASGIDYGQNIMDLYATYKLDIYLSNGTKISGDLESSGLQTIPTRFTESYQLFYVPAMPDQGFMWPYVIVLPPNHSQYDHGNLSAPQYLMVEGINNGYDPKYDSYINKLPTLMNTLSNGASNGLQVARELMMPYMMPLIARADVGYELDGQYNYLYTHALDRDTAIMASLLKDSKVGKDIEASFINNGFTPSDFIDLPGQIERMMAHCIAYMNSQGFDLNEKVMMYGYSAQGTFDDRFTTLYPERVKAYASGATTDDLILPLDTYEGDDLIFPIGVSDYESITGRPFDMTAHNQVARVIFMGKDDTNDVTQFQDCYGTVERDLIYKHWGTDLLQRAIALTNLYGEVGGEGLFILEVGQAHGSSPEMHHYLAEFFDANRRSQGPVYPIPNAPAILEYTLFE